jgi:hypothetical protein
VQYDEVLFCLQIFVDDVLVYKGNLERSPDKEALSSGVDSHELGDRWKQRSVNGRGGDDIDLSQTILFTNDPFVTRNEADRVPVCDDCIEFIDEGTVKAQDTRSTTISRPMTTHSGRRS